MNTRNIRVTLLAAVVLAGPARAGVIGEDGRRAPGADDTALIHALGHIVCARVIDNRRRRSAGTAAVVGNRSTILTAAHIFADDAGRRGPAVRFAPVADCVFRQYDAAGDVSIEARFRYAEMGEYWRNPGAPNQDWAVLTTAEPLPQSIRALPFANTGDRLENITRLPIRILAFHADVRTAGRVPLLSEGELFPVDYGGYSRLAHTADIGRMSSGAAIVYRTDDGQDVVVGINRSSAKLGEFNLAVPLSRELLDILKSHAFGQVPIHRQRLATLDRRRTSTIWLR